MRRRKIKCILPFRFTPFSLFEHSIACPIAGEKVWIPSINLMFLSVLFTAFRVSIPNDAESELYGPCSDYDPFVLASLSRYFMGEIFFFWILVCSGGDLMVAVLWIWSHSRIFMSFLLLCAILTFFFLWLDRLPTMIGSSCFF